MESALSGEGEIEFGPPQEAQHGQFRVHRARFLPPLSLLEVEDATRAAGVNILSNGTVEHTVLYAAVVLFVRLEKLDADGRVMDMDEGVFRSDSVILQLSDLERLDEIWSALMESIMRGMAEFKTQGSNWVVSHAVGMSVETAKARDFGGSSNDDDTCPREKIEHYLKTCLSDRFCGVEVLPIDLKQFGHGCFNQAVAHLLGPTVPFTPAKATRGFVRLQDVDTFEKNNPNLCVNVLWCRPDYRVVPVRVSKKANDLKKINKIPMVSFTSTCCSFLPSIETCFCVILFLWLTWAN